MTTKKKALVHQIQKYHFELRHLMTLFVILVGFQMGTTLIHKISISRFLSKTQLWYQNDFVDRLANLSATSLELLLETVQTGQHSAEEKKRIIQAFNIVLTQQRLQQHVHSFFLILEDEGRVQAIDNGQDLYDFLMQRSRLPVRNSEDILPVLARYQSVKDVLVSSEETHISMAGRNEFHVFVPFVPKGEYLGALYMKSTPEFGKVTQEIVSSYNQTSIIFTALILLGFMGMFFISTNTVSERDKTQAILFQEREKQITKDVHYQKEAQFTKRIYHTHHKAEKIMGFIKEDLRILKPENLEIVKARVIKYANFISRVIYDMKWYDPPLQAIRSQLFKTDLNEVIRFIVDHIFNRISSASDQFGFHLDLDENLIPLRVNEFVIWEVIEPLIQNCIDHGGHNDKVEIYISTRLSTDNHYIELSIADNGPGFDAALLEPDANGTAVLFHEHVTTKTEQVNKGYGCYIAYAIARQRCGWIVEADNRPEGGALFRITIPVK